MTPPGRHPGRAPGAGTPAGAGPVADPDTVRADAAGALREDLGPGDLAAPLLRGRGDCDAAVRARERAVLCGQAWFDACLALAVPGGPVSVGWRFPEGAEVAAGSVVCGMRGPPRSILAAERCALNFLQTLSGTATAVRRFAEAVADLPVRVVDTRKTLPGLRLAQKHAVRVGGGTNHRLGLHDGLLLKENHLAVLGGIGEAVRLALGAGIPDARLQVEVRSVAGLEAAIGAGARRVLLDNLGVDETRRAVGVARAQGGIELESSGNITLANVRDYALTGVDRVSLGTLTKDVRAVDFSLTVAGADDGD